MKQEDIRNLMEFFDKTGISKIKIKEEGFEIELEKYKKGHNNHSNEACCPAPAPAPAPINLVVNNEAKPVSKSSAKDTLDSPMVGTFYAASSPGAAPFVKPGQTVTKGTTIAIIEAMKIMNEIEAEFDCRILEVLVSDSQPVEFGMPLFSVEKL